MSEDNRSESSSINNYYPAPNNFDNNQHVCVSTNTDKIRLKNSIISIIKENSEEFYDLITEHVFNLMYLKKNPPDHKMQVLDIIKKLEAMK